MSKPTVSQEFREALKVIAAEDASKVHNAELRARVLRLQSSAAESQALASLVDQGCCGRKLLRGRSEKCSECPL